MRVSVLIPSFNHADYICRAIESATSSATLDIEVIVVDDGSTDDTRERLEKYDSDPRIRTEYQTNHGAHVALNRAIDLASGEFISILNSDDTYQADRLPRLIKEFVNRRDSVIATSWIQIIDDKGNNLGVKKGWQNLPPWPPSSPGPYLSDLSDPTLALLETNFISTTSNLVFRRELVTEHGLQFRPLRYAHDWDFALSASHHGSVIVVPDPLVNYRVHGSNTIREGTENSVGDMRFEILWVVARHALSVLRTKAGEKESLGTLLRFARNSMPTFGRHDILDELLLIRGASDEPPVAFMHLLDPLNSFREACIRALAVTPD